MRKFIIKNRPKRKYTKKSEQNSSLLFGNTFLGMLPLLVTVITLMATIVITSSTRNPLANIRLTFDPQIISPQNLFEIIKSYVSSMQDMYGIFLSILGIILATFSHLFQIAVSVSTHVTATLDPRPRLSFVGSSLEIMIKGILTFLLSFRLSTQTFFITILSTLVLAVQVIWTGLTTFFLLLTNESIILIRILEQATMIATQTIFSFVFSIYHFIITLFFSFLVWIESVFAVFGVWVDQIFIAIVKLIEWPFKVIGAYLLHYKPLTDFLGKHIVMALSDTKVCFSNLSRTLMAIHSGK